MADLKALVRDPDFQKLSWQDRHDVMSQLDPDYAALPPEGQAEVMNGLKAQPYWKGATKAQAAPAKQAPAKQEKLPATSGSILPRAMLGAEDVNRSGVQQAQDITQAPRIERPLMEYQQPDTLTALQQGANHEAVDLNATAAQTPDAPGPLGTGTMMPSHVSRGPLSAARQRMDTRGFGIDPSATAARQQLTPIANIIKHPAGAAISGAMGVAKGVTLGLASPFVDNATEAMPSVGLIPSKLAEGAGEFAGVVAPWEGIAGAVGHIFGLGNETRIGRVAAQAATGGIVGGEIAQNEGRDAAEESAIGGVSAGVITRGIEVPGEIANSDWWRKLTVKERGIITQSLDDIKAGLKAQGWDDSKIANKMAYIDKDTYQEALKNRMSVEGYEAPTEEQRAADMAKDLEKNPRKKAAREAASRKEAEAQSAEPSPEAQPQERAPLPTDDRQAKYEAELKKRRGIITDDQKPGEGSGAGPAAQEDTSNATEEPSSSGGARSGAQQDQGSVQEGDGEAPAGGAAADGEGAGTATARPATARRDEIAQKYADALGQPEAKDFHRSFADSILNGDAAGLKYLSNGLNDKGKKVFTAVTGAKLPRGQAKTWDAIQDWAKSQEVANGKKAEVSGQEETARTGVDAANGNGERLAGERLPDSGVQGGATGKEPAIIGSDGKDAVTPGVSDQHDTASTGHGPLESTGATSQVQAAGEGSNGRAPGASSGTPVATGPDQRPEHQALQLRGDGAVKPGQSNPTGTDKRDGRAVLEAPPAPTEPVTVQTGSMDGKKIPAPAAPGSIGKNGSSQNIALDKSDAAIAAKNYEEADKWLAKADEIQAQWEKLKGEDEYVRDPEQVNQEGRGSSGDIEQPDSEAVLDDDQGGSGETARTDSVDVPAGRQTSIKNAVTESEEEGGPIPRDGGFTHQSLVDIGRNKVENDPLYNIRDRARKIASNPLEPTNIEDYSALLYDKVRLLKQGDALRELRIAAVAANDPREIARTRQAVAVIEDDFEANRQATVIAGRWGFSAHGHLRQTYVDDDYQVIPMVNTAEMITGKKLDTEANLRTIIEKQAEEIARTKKAFQDAVEKSELEKQQRGVQRIKNDEATAPASRRRAKREVSREQNDQAFKSLASKLRDVLSPYRLNMNFDPEAVAVLTDMMRLRIANGTTKAADIIDDIYDELHGDYAIEKRDIADALSGYGKQFAMSQEELDVTSREVKRQLRLMSALEDAEAGIIPGQSGLKHDKQTEEVRRLREKVKQAMKASGIDNKSTLDPESQWKTSLDAVKTRLRNRRTDVKRQIDAKKRDPVKKTGIKYDQDALALQEEVNHLNEMLDAIDSKPGISAQRRIEMVINSQDKSIENLERQIAKGDVASKAKVTGVETQEIAKRRAKLDILRKTRDQMRKDALPPKVPKTEAEKEAIYNKAYRTRLEKMKATLDEKRANGDYEKSARKVHQLEESTKQAKADYEKSKQKWDTMRRQLERENRGTVEKIADTALGLQRFAILTSSGIIVKILAVAAYLRPLESMTEGLASEVNRRMPFLSLISEGAPRHGSGISVRGEAAGLVQLFKRETYRNAWQRLLHGKDDIQIRVGGDKNSEHYQSWGGSAWDKTEYVLGVAGRGHSALKAITYTPEFYRSLQYYYEAAIKNKLDTSSFEVNAMIEISAEAEANRAQLMGDNFISSWVRQGMRMLRQKGPGGHLAAAGFKSIYPVATVATNFTGELLSYIPPIGAGKTLAMIAKGYWKLGKIDKASEYLTYALYKKAVESMTEEEMEYAAKSANFGLVGSVLAFLFITGYFGCEHFGGFHRKGEKPRGPHELKPGEVRVDGISFPAHMFHSKAFGVIQAYATVGHVVKIMSKHEADRPKSEHTTTGAKVAEGATKAAWGMLDQVPYIGQTGRYYNEAQSWEGMKAVTRHLVESIIIPIPVQNYAHDHDKAGEVVIPRKGGISADIPGMRKSLPVDMNKVKRMQLDQLAEIMEHGPGSVKDQVFPEFRKKFRNSHGLSDEDKERYLNIISEGE